RYADIYNHAIPQRALGHVAPINALAEWRERKPELFVSAVDNLTGLDIYLIYRANGERTYQMTSI
ncbi:MAG: hypothetical protein ACXW17_17135, partial [Methylomagnum sp.]